MTAFVYKLELTDNEFACLKRIVDEYISDQSTDKSKCSAADGLLLKVQNAEIKDMFAEQIERLRLGKMLAALGVDIDAYVSMERTVYIREQITHCMACDNTEECDDRLTEGVIDADNISFCNNEKSLQELTRSI